MLLVHSIRIGTRTGGLGNNRMSRDHPNDRIIKIDQNTEKSPGDLRRLAVIQTSVKTSQRNKIITPNQECMRGLKRLKTTRIWEAGAIKEIGMKGK